MGRFLTFCSSIGEFDSQSEGLHADRPLRIERRGSSEARGGGGGRGVETSEARQLVLWIAWLGRDGFRMGLCHFIT